MEGLLMRISAKCNYGLNALLELALQWPNKKPLQIQDIAKKQGIPTRYLVQILIRLKSMKLVKSVRGKEGGYLLSKNPKEIHLGNVLRELEGPLFPVVENTSAQETNVFFEIWQKADKAIADVVDPVTFEDLCRKAAGARKILTYSI